LNEEFGWNGVRRAARPISREALNKGVVMRRNDSQLGFLGSAFTVLALAVFVLPACDDTQSGDDSGENDSMYSGMVASTVLTSSIPATLASTSGACSGFELVGQLMLTNGGKQAMEFNNNFNPGEVIDTAPSAGRVAPGDTVGLSVFANCSGGEVDGFLQLDVTDTEGGSPNTGAINAPVRLSSSS
jgi:hypothetical protein